MYSIPIHDAQSKRCADLLLVISSRKMGQPPRGSPRNIGGWLQTRRLQTAAFQRLSDHSSPTGASGCPSLDGFCPKSCNKICYAFSEQGTTGIGSA